MPFPQSELLDQYFAQQPDVLVVYLFGSQATGRARPDSDIDLAVLLTEADSYTHLERRLYLGNQLEQILQQHVDVIVLNRAPPLLVYEVLKNRTVLFERDEQIRIEFEVRQGKIYADLKPTYDFFTEVLLQRIKEGKFGQGYQRSSQREIAETWALCKRTT